jgi:hypothetical protein
VIISPVLLLCANTWLTALALQVGMLVQIDSNGFVSRPKYSSMLTAEWSCQIRLQGRVLAGSTSIGDIV